VPYGLGGLALSLAHAIEVLNMNLQLVICEISGAAPFARALKAGVPVVGDKLKSFIEAMGTPAVIPDVFDYLKTRVAGVVEVTEQEVKNVILATFAENNLRLEGAAGASLAAARKLGKNNASVVAILTGSNISFD
jgi:threonine dehydratase